MMLVTRHHLYSLALSTVPLLWAVQNFMAVAHSSGGMLLLVCLSPGVLLSLLINVHTEWGFFSLALLANMLYYEGIFLLWRCKTQRRFERDSLTVTDLE